MIPILLRKNLYFLFAIPLCSKYSNNLDFPQKRNVFCDFLRDYLFPP